MLFFKRLLCFLFGHIPVKERVKKNYINTTNGSISIGSGSNNGGNITLRGGNALGGNIVNGSIMLPSVYPIPITSPTIANSYETFVQFKINTNGVEYIKEYKACKRCVMYEKTFKIGRELTEEEEIIKDIIE